ncbi:MFS transporter [Streptomyces sp. N2-109]|uniref:MFS transporter n=1 Tax=Streptomyces gossypii TaxID=2883101 RepID=A0ABT2JLR8_9ACTN|nr:MFS transporter [Streptomyces gossypii]MCT2588454.1 MFS transporter [Streptomyces gossypii]
MPPAPARTRPRTFRSLSVRNFRLFATGQVISVAGTWMMVVAQDWLVLEMTGDSAGALATVTALQFTPLLLLTLQGGRLADRYDKRALLTAANTASGLLAAALALLTLTGTAALWHVWIAAAALGTVNALEVPTRMAFVGELVGPDLLPNASALSAAYFNTARVLGPAAAGALIAAAGTGAVMLANAASYLATVAALRRMRPAELHRAERPHTRPRVTDALRYTASRPDLKAALLLLAAVSLFGLNFQLTLPLLAKTVLNADAAAFGLATTAFAAGSLLAALAGTARTRRPAARLVTASALALGLLETAAGAAPTLATCLPLLFATGFAALHFTQAANHRIQLGSDPRYRGRVMALYTLILQGSTPLGALATGWAAATWGARWGLVLGGLATAAAAGAALAATARRPTGKAPPP